MNTRIAKKILCRPWPATKKPTEQMVRAGYVYRRALRRSDGIAIKWRSLKRGG